MGDLKARIKAKFSRRNSSTAPSPTSIKNSLGFRHDGSSSIRTNSNTHATRPQSSTNTGYAASEEQNDSNSLKHQHSSSFLTQTPNPPKKVPAATKRATDAGANANANANASDFAPPGRSVPGGHSGHSGLISGRQPAELLFSEESQASSPPGLNPITAKPAHSIDTVSAVDTSQTWTSSPGPTHQAAAAPNNISGNDLHTSSTTPPSLSINPPTLPSIHEHPAATTSATTSPPHPPSVDALNQLQNTIVNPNPPISRSITAGTSTTLAVDDYLNTPEGEAIHTPLSLAIPSNTSPALARPTAPIRQQSLLSTRQTALIKSLLQADQGNEVEAVEPNQLFPLAASMVTRKIWVKRPLASATLVTINEDDLVDDVRDMILRKYANSLGRQFDAPDLTLRIHNKEQQSTRYLQPDEPMARTIDAYFPGGQTVDDALLIDIPSRRTPKASPNPRFYADDRPHESGTDYFPPYPPPHAHHPGTAAATVLTGPHTLHFPPSMAVVGGAQLPPLPSPGATRRLGGGTRPKVTRMHTASPASTVTNGHPASQTGAVVTGTHNYARPAPRSRTHSGASSDQPNHLPAAPAIPTPPPVERTDTPPPRVASPRPVARPKKVKKTIEHPTLPPGLLDGAVPPINVLIVEDNMINLRLLEAFVKRLKVRWQTAVNGLEAVNKWRSGGFHLVLMDIQLPVMSGLEATREIRRIEKVNSIGVFSSSASSPPDDVKPEPEEKDTLANTEMFKSPVIIVALTASSLQSDRHEALAAGCNDFLTKPVNFVWLERKVKEWGCMQALIDFDGWRKWKDFSQKAEADDAAKKAAAAAASKTKPVKKNRVPTMTAAA